MEDINEQSRARSGTGLGDEPHGPSEDEEITVESDSVTVTGEKLKTVSQRKHRQYLTLMKSRM